MAGAVLALSLGCAQDDGPLGVRETGGLEAESLQATLTCTVDVRAGGMACGAPGASLPDGISGAMIGGQGHYLLLESWNVQYDAGSSSFRALVTVRNFLTQTLGAVLQGDTVQTDPNGVRIVLLSDPQVTSGAGAVTLVNPTGRDIFSSSEQAYYQYDQALAPGQRSLPMEWLWSVPPEVLTFTFTAAVHASVVHTDAINAGLKFLAGTFSAGNLHSCGLTLDGSAYCWGSGDHGRLGTGSDDSQSIPTPVAGGLEFAVLSTGLEHSCGLTTTGAAYCWGGDAEGQLGNGAPLANSTVPVAVNGGRTFLTLSSGYHHSCGVTTSGAAYCWGQGFLGRLGNGSLDLEAVHEPVAVGGGLTFASISAGAEHTCGVTDTGKAYCWGKGEKGRLGDGDSTSARSVPIAVLDPAGGPVTYSEISAGGSHTCALTTAGTAYCWGWNAAGQIGNPLAPTIVTPVAVEDPVGGPVTFISISAGGAHTCALTTTGAAYCWGWNLYGQLGDDDDPLNPKVKPTPVVGGYRFVSISAGDTHTCAVTGDGVAYCWGNGGLDRLGNGTSVDRFVPTPVSTITNFAFQHNAAPATCQVTAPGAASWPVGCSPRRTTFEVYAYARSGNSMPWSQARGDVDYYRAGHYRAEG